MKSWKAELFLFLVTFIWGATFFFTKIGLNDCPPSFYIILRFAIALGASNIFFFKYWKGIDSKTIRQGIILGLFFGGGFLLQTYGLKMTTVSKSAFITGMTVPLTPFIFWLVEKKPVARWQIIGVILGTAGLWIFSNPKIDNVNIGDILTLLSTLFWAFYITYMDVFTRERHEFRETAQILMLQFLAAGPLAALPFFISEYQTLHVHFTPGLIGSLAFNGLVASFLVTLIHTSVQRYTTPVKAALIFALEPIFATIIAVMALKEIILDYQYFGGMVLMLGVIISQTGDSISERLRLVFCSKEKAKA